MGGAYKVNSVVLFVSSCSTTAMNQVKNMIKVLEPGLKSPEVVRRQNC